METKNSKKISDEFYQEILEKERNDIINSYLEKSLQGGKKGKYVSILPNIFNDESLLFLHYSINKVFVSILGKSHDKGWDFLKIILYDAGKSFVNEFQRRDNITIIPQILYLFYEFTDQYFFQLLISWCENNKNDFSKFKKPFKIKYPNVKVDAGNCFILWLNLSAVYKNRIFDKKDYDLFWSEYINLQERKELRKEYKTLSFLKRIQNLISKEKIQNINTEFDLTVRSMKKESFAQRQKLRQVPIYNYSKIFEKIISIRKNISISHSNVLDKIAHEAGMKDKTTFIKTVVNNRQYIKNYNEHKSISLLEWIFKYASETELKELGDIIMNKPT